MRMPRNISGRDLIKKLEVFGYSVSRQSGSHIRVTSKLNGDHHLTIPDHSELRVGTLNSIISELSVKLDMPKPEVIKKLFY